MTRATPAPSAQRDSSAYAPGTSGGSTADAEWIIVFERRIYIFASENCRESFKVAPERYLPSSVKPVEK